jgi:hypothetical protein
MTASRTLALRINSSCLMRMFARSCLVRQVGAIGSRKHAFTILEVEVNNAAAHLTFA